MKKIKWIIILAIVSASLYGIVEICFYFIKKYNKTKCNYTASYTKKLHPYFTPEYHGQFTYNAWDKIDKDFLLKVFVPLDIKGIVLNKYINECDHYGKTIDIELTDSYISILPYQLLNETDSLYEKIKIGDSIFKKSNSLIIIVKCDSLINDFKVSPYEEYWVDSYFIKESNNKNDK